MSAWRSSFHSTSKAQALPNVGDLLFNVSPHLFESHQSRLKQ
jgi:hypothetical protein